MKEESTFPSEDWLQGPDMGCYGREVRVKIKHLVEVCYFDALARKEGAPFVVLSLPCSDVNLFNDNCAQLKKDRKKMTAVADFMNTQDISFEGGSTRSSGAPVLGTPAAAAPVAVATCWKVAGGVAGFASVVGAAVALFTAADG
jgi:hypothetical protein